MRPAMALNAGWPGAGVRWALWPRLGVVRAGTPRIPLHVRQKHDSSSVLGIRRAYSEEDLTTIIREKIAGKTFSQISVLLDRSIGSVSKIFYRELAKNGSSNYLIKTQRPLTAEDTATIARMRGEKKTWRHIADVLEKGISNVRRHYIHHTVSKHCKNYMDSGAVWSAAEVERLLHTRDNLKMSWEAIALDMQRSSMSATNRYFLEKARPNTGPQRWTPEEEQLLTTLRDEQSRPWAAVARALPRRSESACIHRYHARLKGAGAGRSRSFSTLAALGRQPFATHTHTTPLCTTGLLLGCTSRPTLELRAINRPHRLVHTETPVRGGGSRYTTEEKKTILQRRRELVSFPDIASELGRHSADGVRSHFYELVKCGEDGVIKRNDPISPSELKGMAEKRAAGFKWRDIGRMYGREEKTCANRYHLYVRANLQPHLRNLPDRVWTDAENLRLQDCRDRQGQSWYEIAEGLQRTQSAVRHHYSALKVKGQTRRPTVKNAYSLEEDYSILYLRGFLGLGWKQIQPLIPQRSLQALSRHYGERLGPKKIANYQSTVQFTPQNYALLHDLRSKQQLSWEAVQEKMPGWTIQDLQDRHALLAQWPPPANFSLSTAKQSRSFTTVTASSMRFFGNPERSLWTSPRPGTFRTSKSVLSGGRPRFYHVSRCPLTTFASPRRGVVKLRLGHSAILRQTWPSQSLLGSTTRHSSTNAASPVSVTLGRSKWQRYSIAEIDLMVQRRKDGMSYPEIALEMGRSSYSVKSCFYQWASKNGMEHLVRRNKKRIGEYDRHEQQIKQMKSSGATWNTVAAQTGLNATELGKIYNEREKNSMLPTILPQSSRHGKPFSEAEVHTLQHSRDVLGRSWPEIGHEMGRSPRGLSTRYYSQRLKLSADRPARYKVEYSQVEKDMLYQLRSVQKLSFKEIQRLMPSRTHTSLRMRYHRMVGEAEAAKHISRIPGEIPEPQKL